MLFRFGLYGFLKNQKYYEPFLLLVFLEKGLSFFDIGLLIGFRAVCINLLEVPSGALADLYGRRRAMLLSFSAYLASFALFTYAETLQALFAAMSLFALGETFRSGTHKAMIFDWLTEQGRSHEKARVYGITRSWSQLGSATSVLVAATIVLWQQDYSQVFLYSMVPYSVGLLNFLGYPKNLDGSRAQERSLKRVAEHLLNTLRDSWHRPRLRALLTESMAQRGTWEVGKDYLQPVLQQFALALPMFLALEGQDRVAILVGVTYFVLHLLSAATTRQAHHLRDLCGGNARFTFGVFLLTGVAYALLWSALQQGLLVLVVALFVALAVLQNAWKPIFLERVDETSEAAMGATVLSLDQQAKALFVAVMAPILGKLVDLSGLVAVGALGTVTSLLIVASLAKSNPRP